ncbi:MAG: hypothetical protein QM689_05820 [Oscillospiraceae bacterium]
MKSKLSQLVTYWTAVLAAVLFSILAVVLLNAQTDRLRYDYLAAQADLLRTAVNTAEISIQAADSEDAVLAAIKNQPQDAAAYWFLASGETVLFERNDAVTAEVAGLTYDQLRDRYLRAGGSGISDYMNLLGGGGDFSALVTTDNAYGAVLITAGHAQAAGKTYTVAVCIQQSILLERGGIVERILFLRILTAALCLVVVGATLTGVWLRYRARLRIARLENDLTEKNLVLAQLQDRLVHSTAEPADPQTDPATGLYSRRFLESVLAKIDARDPDGAGFAVIRTDGIDPAHLREAAAAVTRLTEETDLCCAAAQNAIVVIKLRTSGEILAAFAQAVTTQLTPLAAAPVPVAHALRPAGEPSLATLARLLGTE